MVEEKFEIKKIKEGELLLLEKQELKKLLIIADGGMIVCCNCNGELAVVANKNTTVYFGSDCNCEINVAPFSNGEVRVWNAYGVTHATPYFSEWFKG